MNALVLGLALTVQHAAPPAAPSFARAESLLHAHNFPAALRVAERLVAAQPRDARAHLLLGRVHYARPIVGRYQALAAFKAAARLAPLDPEPRYWMMKVGWYLGSDEGDGIAREALLALFAVTPDYADAWTRFNELYQSPEIWRRADQALARHPDHPLALERRAQLAIALDEPERAESLLARVLALRAPHLPAYLLRAEANYQAGRDAAGQKWVDSALAYADLDSTGVLWDNAWMIATPEEAARHAATPPGERRRFFAWFWSRRDPNLVSPENERLGEHFRRIAYVRRSFRLLHPQSLYFRSARARALTVMSSRGYLADQVTVYPELLPTGSADRQLVAGRLAPDPRDVGDTTEGGSQMYVAGVDARGLIYLRHGPPDLLLRGYFDPLRPESYANPLDAEGWLYQTPSGPVSLGFRRGTGDLMGITSGAGDFAFFPVTRRQARDTRVALRTDRTALPAPLEARAWIAFFKNAESGLTDAYFKSAPETAAVVLWDGTGAEAVRASGTGVLLVSVPPGGYDLGFDVDSAGVVGRRRDTLAVPAFSGVELGLSSLALAPADSLTDREATLQRMPADLVFAAGTPLSAYAEVYGLTPDEAGRAHYRVRYRFAPIRSLVGRLFAGAAPVEFEFERATLSPSRTREQLVLEPGRVPPGRYRVSLAVTDLRRNVKSESVAVEITVR